MIKKNELIELMINNSVEENKDESNLDLLATVM